MRRPGVREAGLELHVAARNRHGLLFNVLVAEAVSVLLVFGGLGLINGGGGNLSGRRRSGGERGRRRRRRRR